MTDSFYNLQIHELEREMSELGHMIKTSRTQRIKLAQKSHKKNKIQRIRGTERKITSMIITEEHAWKRINTIIQELKNIRQQIREDETSIEEIYERAYDEYNTTVTDEMATAQKLLDQTLYNQAYSNKRCRN